MYIVYIRMMVIPPTPCHSHGEGSSFDWSAHLHFASSHVLSFPARPCLIWERDWLNLGHKRKHSATLYICGAAAPTQQNPNMNRCQSDGASGSRQCSHKYFRNMRRVWHISENIRRGGWPPCPRIRAPRGVIAPELRQMQISICDGK